MNDQEKLTKRMRVTIVVPSELVPEWIVSVVRRLLSRNTIEIKQIIIECDDGAAGKYKGSKDSRAKDDVRIQAKKTKWFSFLYWVFESLCQSRPENDNALVLKDINLSPFGHEQDNGVDIDRKLPRTAIASFDYLAENCDISEVDLFVHLGQKKIGPKMISLAKYGVLTLEHADSVPLGFTNLSGFWESVEERPITACVVNLYEKGHQIPLVLSRTWAATATSASEDNRQSITQQAIPLIPRVIDSLQIKGAEKLIGQARLDNLHPRIYSDRFAGDLTSANLAYLIWKRLKRRGSKAVETIIWKEQWSLFARREIGPILALNQFINTAPPKDRFWADPYLLKNEEKIYVFFEEVLASTRRGRIAVGEISEGNKVIKVRTALEAPHHLSHPFVIKHQGKVYMLPESRASRCITLYRNVEMPDKWERECDLMQDVDASDVNLHFHDDRWWLFVNMADGGGSTSVELFIFSSPTFPSASWEPHPLNPVISDVRRARSAGALFNYNGELYRPSQDCSHLYGWKFAINIVEQLDRENYSERRIALAEPRWAANIVRTHTFNQIENVQVIDGMVRRSRLW
jgi:hypothetical protein